MTQTLAGIDLWPGLIVSISKGTPFGFMIRRALGRSYSRITGDPSRNCPTHTAMVVEYNGRLWIGDTISPRSVLTPISEYERLLAKRTIWNLQLFEVCALGREQQSLAAAWWNDNVLGHLYDWPAFGRLALKAAFGDIFKSAAGLEWAHWCTEGVMLAYKHGAGYDIFQNANPTPVTVIKRWAQGQLRLIQTIPTMGGA